MTTFPTSHTRFTVTRPSLALTVLVTVVLGLPFLALGLAAVLIVAPPYAIWRLAGRARRRRRRHEPAPSGRPMPVRSPHAP